MRSANLRAMTDAPTIVARLACDEPTARRLAFLLGERLDAEDTVCGAFEDADGQWQVAIHFRAPPDEAAVRDFMRLAAGEAAADALSFAPVEAADWVALSLAGLRPVRAGRFIVYGAHDRARAPVNALRIEIEAALAFGTGHHGTTRGCLLALNALAKRRHPAPIPPPARGRDKKKKRVLDLGTGSGVLAIAAAKALRTRIVATDIDRQAATAARANARLNGVAPWITLAQAAGTKAPAIAAAKPYFLIFANILLGPLTRLAVPICRLAARGARVVLSGLLPAQANAALAIYRAQGLTLERRIVLEGWVTLVLARPKRNRPGLGPGRLRIP